MANDFTHPGGGQRRPRAFPLPHAIVRAAADFGGRVQPNDRANVAIGQAVIALAAAHHVFVNASNNAVQKAIKSVTDNLRPHQLRDLGDTLPSSVLAEVARAAEEVIRSQTAPVNYSAASWGELIKLARAGDLDAQQALGWYHRNVLPGVAQTGSNSSDHGTSSATYLRELSGGSYGSLLKEGYSRAQLDQAMSYAQAVGWTDRDSIRMFADTGPAGGELAKKFEEARKRGDQDGMQRAKKEAKENEDGARTDKERKAWHRMGKEFESRNAATPSAKSEAAPERRDVAPDVKAAQKSLFDSLSKNPNSAPKP